MALNYQTILEKDFSSGINKLAAEDVVPQTFVENMENMDPNAQGYVEKRKGYQSYAGSLPLRVAKAERNADGILFLYFDELEGGTANIDFSTLKSSPVILYGTTTLKTATTASSYYYSSFIVDPRVVLGTPTTLQAADIGATTRDLFIGLGYNSSEDESAGNKNIEIVYANTVSVNPSTFNVSIDSIEGMTGQVKCYVYINNHATLAGESWADTVTEDTEEVDGQTVTIPGRFTVNQAIHQLNTQNYITRYYDPVSGEEIFPDSVVVTGSTIVTQFTGQANPNSVRIVPSSVRIVIRAVPEIDVATGRTALKDNTTTLSIPIDADFAFFDIYEEVGSTYSRVFPDKIYINQGTAEITLRNETADNVKLKIVWERASVRTNKLALADTATTFTLTSTFTSANVSSSTYTFTSANVAASTNTFTSTTVFQVGDHVSYNGTAWVLNASSSLVIQQVDGPVDGIYTYTITGFVVGDHVSYNGSVWVLDANSSLVVQQVTGPVNGLYTYTTTGFKVGDRVKYNGSVWILDATSSSIVQQIEGPVNGVYTYIITVFQVGDRVKYNGTAWVLDATSSSVVQKVEGPVESAYTYTISEIDLVPQLCLYGLDHAVLYPDNPKRAGWVTHIDSYKSEGENYLVAGLGWNLFKAVYDSSLPSRQPLLRTSVAVQANVGPLFGPAGRDRKSYSFTGGAEGWANIVSINYQSSTGWTRVVVSTPNRVASDDALPENEQQSPGVDPEHDRLTIMGCSQKVHRGEWAIMAFSEQDDTLTFDVMNPNIDSSDYDEDSVGEAGCFTDKVTFVAPSNLVYSLHYGDILEGDAFPMGLSGSLSCVSTVGNTSWLTGVGEVFSFPEGQIYTVRKTGRILQFRDVNSPASNPFENFVAGDVLRFSDRTRRHRIHRLIPANLTGIFVGSQFRALSVSVDGELGETTITDVDSSSLVAGQWVLLSSAGRFSGEYQVKELPNTTTIVLDSSNVKDTSTPSSFAAPYLSGRTVELGYEDEFTDDPNSLLTVQIGLRWFPLENPTGSPSRVKHFESSPYSDQPFVRSVMAQDNMYFANYNDHLLKYDGQSLFRSGLIRWQPGIFAVADEDHVGKIIVPQQISVAMDTTKDALYLGASSDTIGAFAVGSEISIANSNLNPYTITAIDTSTQKIFLNKQTTDVPTGTTQNVKITQYQPNIYRYYFRLTAYDANDNVVTSATTGSNEFYVSLRKSSAINLRLIGLPKFEQLNYSKVYLEVYRTKRNSVAPFYNIIKKKLDFDPTYPYIDIVDTVSDEALPAQPDDAVLTFISGERLGNGLSQPPQAKYCTVADNKLVLGNIQDDPKIQLDIFGNPELSQFNGQVFHMRKDGVQPVAPLQPINDLTYELTSELIPIANASLSNVLSPTMSLTYTATSSVNNFQVGEWVYIYHASLPTQGLFVGSGWQKVQSSNGAQFTITLPYQPVPSQEIITITDENNLETNSSPGFIVGDKLTLTLDGTVYKYTKLSNQAEPGADYFVVLTKTTQVVNNVTIATYTIQHYSYFSSTTIEENVDTANNPTGFVLGAYLVFNSADNAYTLAPSPLNTVNYHRIMKKIPGGTGNDKYIITHYHYPENIARCSVGNRNSKCFPVFIGTDYNYGWKNANNDLLYSAGSRVLLRLSNAMNFSQTIQTTPWFYANAGLDLGGQSLLVSFPENSLQTTPEMVMPTNLGTIEYYGNKIKVTQSGENVGAVTTKFPSRLVISYTNFAEVFHRPFDDSATFSDSIVDVNPADGQEITGVFPFFSEAAFGASLKAASIIVFKSNSIYIVDPASRRAQQIESNGLGCTAPYSIAATREGLMFANEAGLYRLTRSLTVEPIGSFIDRLWREDVNKSQLALLQGHAYSVGRKYKVSIPRSGESVPQDVLVYDYTREDSKNTYGSWTRYTNHPATGWCNLLEDSFFASTVGRVYKVSNENSKYDYQDDGAGIDGFTVFRALDFGDSAVRKRVLHLLVHYRIPNLEEGQVDIDTATVSMGVNLVDNFLALDTFKLDVPNTPDGLSTLAPNKQVTLRYAVRNPKSLYFQVKIQDNGLHTPLQVTGLSFRVAGLSTEGVTEAAQTVSKE